MMADHIESIQETSHSLVLLIRKKEVVETYINILIKAFSVHVSFDTSPIKKVLMMENSKVFKMKETIKEEQLFRFQIDNLELMRVTFTADARFDTKEFPIVEISDKGVHFCRHLANGISYAKAAFSYPLVKGEKYDFFMLITGATILFGKFENFRFETIGFYDYDELESLTYVGFSSTAEATFIVEDAASGNMVLLNDTFAKRELNMFCTNRNTGFYSVWELEV